MEYYSLGGFGMSKRETHSAKKHLLIVEPNVNHAELLVNLLVDHPQWSQISCKSVETADAAIDAVKKKRGGNFDLILSSDLNSERLPYCWTAKLRRLQPESLIVILTTNNTAQKIREHLSSGATEVLLKTQDNLRSLPELLFRYLDPDAKPYEEAPAWAAVNEKVQKILRNLNRLGNLATSKPQLPRPLNSIRQDVASLTKIVKDLL